MLKTASETAVLFKYGRIPEQIMRQSAWKSGCILDASDDDMRVRADKGAINIAHEELAAE